MVNGVWVCRRYRIGLPRWWLSYTWSPRSSPTFIQIHTVIVRTYPAKAAVAVTRKRCWQYDWVVEFDIKGAFDNIDHPLLLKAVRHHVKEPWMLLYIERWLTAPFETVDGELISRDKGTPQGGVVSPLLMNLFLHYVFDRWMERNLPAVSVCKIRGRCGGPLWQSGRSGKNARSNRPAAGRLFVNDASS